jgi:membrane associated rhomboid family serine protease
MVADRNSGNTSPLLWAGSFPVYASTLIALVHVLTMVATALAMAARAEGLIQSLQFSSAAVHDGAVWQFVTYAFVHPPDPFFLLELYMLVVFGRQIEQFLGRNAFLGLYAVLLLLPPLALTAASFFGFSSFYSGSGALHFAVFVAFAALYPAAEILFGIQARWVALFLVAFSLLQALASGDRAGLGVLVLDCGAAFLMVRWLKGGGVLPDWRSMVPARPAPKLHVVKRPEEEEDSSIDSILEKISRSGMSSLTVRERNKLERAREKLLEKDRSR